MDNDTYDDRTNIKFLKQNEVNELQVTINRNIVERIEELEDEMKMINEYSIKGLQDSLRDLQYNTEIKLERIDDILVVHSNQSDNQKKNFHELKKVLDNKVMDLLEKDVPRVTDKEQAIIDLGKTLFGNKKGEHGKG